MQMVFKFRMGRKNRKASTFSAFQCTSAFKTHKVMRPKAKTVKYIALNKTKSRSEEECQVLVSKFCSQLIASRKKWKENTL